MAEHSSAEAQAQYESITDMIARAAQDEIQEDPLSVLVRSEWVEPGGLMAPHEYEILLCTGGPAVRIVGELDDYNEPSSARLEHQDWFKPWTAYHQADEQTLLVYARHFWFGG